MKPIEHDVIMNTTEQLYWIKLHLVQDIDYTINPLLDWCEKNINREWAYRHLSSGMIIILSSKEDMTYVIMKAKCNTIDGPGWQAVLCKN